MMNTPEYDLIGIGRAFTDVIANVDDQFLRLNRLAKGRQVDVSVHDLFALRSQLDDFVQQPGGSASNTVAGVSALGGKTAFIGKLCGDATGKFFRNAFRQHNVLFSTPDHPPEEGAISATCLILMTPDGSVTIPNNRGVAGRLSSADIDVELIKSSAMLFVAGELLAADDSRNATAAAIEVALRANRRIAMNLNHLYANENRFLAKADFLFGNSREFRHNFPGVDLASLKDAEIVHVVLDGARGGYVVGRGNHIEVPPLPFVGGLPRPSYVGAIDQFAAGFLFGYLRRLPYGDCARLGAESAAMALSIAGARPNGDWTALSNKFLPAGNERPLPRQSA